MVSRTQTPNKKQNTRKDPKGDVDMESGRQPNEIRDLLPEEQSNFSQFGRNSRLQA